MGISAISGHEDIALVLWFLILFHDPKEKIKTGKEY
jgi:hypothetical protein